MNGGKSTNLKHIFVVGGCICLRSIRKNYVPHCVATVQKLQIVLTKEEESDVFLSEYTGLLTFHGVTIPDPENAIRWEEGNVVMQKWSELLFIPELMESRCAVSSNRSYFLLALGCHLRALYNKSNFNTII